MTNHKLHIEGADLHDFFAAAALPAVIEFMTKNKIEDKRFHAANAYAVADAMIAERAKRGGQADVF